MKPTKLIRLKSLAVALFAGGSLALAQSEQPTVPERVAVLKATLASSQANLRQYEWIETTVVSLNGEEKSRKQERCYYGADGGLTKVEVSESPEAAKKRGLRGRIAERKKEELTDYMKKAVTLVKTYVPPDPAKVQAAKDAGKVSIEVLEPGKRARLNFKGLRENRGQPGRGNGPRDQSSAGREGGHLPRRRQGCHHARRTHGPVERRHRLRVRQHAQRQGQEPQGDGAEQRLSQNELAPRARRQTGGTPFKAKA